MAKDYPTEPWTIEVGGLVNNPGTFDMDAINKFQQEERVYRMRCVEAWSMVIPWLGFPLAELLKQVEPTSDAKYVRFETVYDPDRLPGQRSDWYQWPYIEGLRLDEAMNDLTLLATGLYGEAMPMQNGAPLRLVVPWKYGFKSIKSIVKIDLVEEQPTSLWMAAAPQRVWLLRQRQPRCQSSPLVPAHRTPHWRIEAARDPALQRIRRTGGVPLRRHEFAGELLGQKADRPHHETIQSHQVPTVCQYRSIFAPGDPDLGCRSGESLGQSDPGDHPAHGQNRHDPAGALAWLRHLSTPSSASDKP